MISLISNKIKALAAGLMLTLALGALGCGGDKKEAGAKAEKVNVGIVQLVEHEALDAANKGFIDGLASKGYKVRTLLLTNKMLRLTSLICRTLLIAL